MTVAKLIGECSCGTALTAEQVERGWEKCQPCWLRQLFDDSPVPS
jgi:hypothetical protein